MTVTLNYSLPAVEQSVGQPLTMYVLFLSLLSFSSQMPRGINKLHVEIYNEVSAGLWVMFV